jgi:O-acetyl-ADP-ribose deacetylase (regulator of RNase III)
LNAEDKMDGTRWLLNDRLGIKVGNITEEKVDAVVNAANSSLMGGGGVDGAIHRKGGPAIHQACLALRKEQYPDGLNPGQAAVTEAGELPCRYVIHTVGPVWRGGGSGEAEKLASAYRESLMRASELKLETAAFPSISTGVYGYPKALAAEVSYTAVKAFLKANPYPGKVYMIFFNPGDRDQFIRALDL